MKTLATKECYIFINYINRQRSDWFEKPGWWSSRESMGITTRSTNRSSEVLVINILFSSGCHLHMCVLFVKSSWDFPYKVV